MNSFEEMGNAILLANEGQQQIARALAQWIASAAATLHRSVSGAFGHSPSAHDA